MQDNESLSAQPGTLRGLHYQAPPFAQAKLVRVARGAILDVAVDARRGSPTYGRWVAEELSAENGAQILVPRGFLHGFLTLTADTLVIYKVDNVYDAGERRRRRCGTIPTSASTGAWRRRALTLSDKDRRAPALPRLDVALRVRSERMRLLVTGGAGFIGSAVVRQAIADGARGRQPRRADLCGNLANLAERRRRATATPSSRPTSATAPRSTGSSPSTSPTR